MSYKNILQEFYQKQCLKLPIYKSINKQHKSNVPQWYTSIILYNGRIYQTKEYETSKKKSEQKCAKLVLTDLGIINEDNIFLNNRSTVLIENKIVIEPMIETYVIIDLENVHEILGLKDKIIKGNNLNILCVINHEHYYAYDKDLLNDNFFNFHLVNVNEKDAVDVYICFYIGFLLGKRSTPFNFILVSKDHFVKCITQIIQNLENVKIVFFVETLNELIKKLHELSYINNNFNLPL